MCAVVESAFRPRQVHRFHIFGAGWIRFRSQVFVIDVVMEVDAVQRVLLSAYEMLQKGLCLDLWERKLELRSKAQTLRLERDVVLYFLTVDELLPIGPNEKEPNI